MNTAQIVHTLDQLANHIPNTLDPFFARGRIATQLKKQALGLAYFRQLDYEEAIKQIHHDFALEGTPFDHKELTTPRPEDLRLVAKHYEDTCRGKRRVEIEGFWCVEKNTSCIMLRPLDSHMVGFQSVNLHSGRILYDHELEGVSHGFTHFLTREDYYSFERLVDGLRQRISS